jgi:CRP/FNR family cyclic AMP-dependent transcriptional regulator
VSEGDVWRRLADGGTRRRYRRGEALFSEGDLSDRVLIVESGWVKVSVASPDGHEAVLGLRGPGQVLGELSILDGAPRSASAIALEPVEATVVRAAELTRALDEDAEVSRELLRELARRLRDADRMRVEFATLDTLARVARRLLELAERFGEPGKDGGIVVALPLSQEEVASWCSASRESTAKALRTLREIGCITTGRRTVTIQDREKLERQAGLRAL